MENSGRIYIGTVLLEKNRWTEKKVPTFRVSEWADRFMADGFDGIELWANHALAADERARLQCSGVSVPVFNSYASLSDAGQAERKQAGNFARGLGCGSIKYNVGNDPSLRETYMENLRKWRAALPDSITLLCECHSGTLLEDVAEARRFFDELGMAGHGIIVHPFNQLDTLEEWFKTFGPAIRHAHLQLHDDHGQIVRFDRNPGRIRGALRIMDDAGFDGSFALEFTEGIGRPDENIDDLYSNALLDLSNLKSLLKAYCQTRKPSSIN